MNKIILLLIVFLFATPVFAADKNESVYDRVMRTGKIKCGYGLWGMYLDQDPNTGKLSGIFYDYLETMGSRLGLKIEWTEEIGWGDFIPGLENKRFDAFCTAVAWSAERARQADYLRPIFFMETGAFASIDDKRFDKNITRANAEDITMVIIEGHYYNKVSKRDFPKAKKLELPQLSSQAELFLSIAYNKADIAIMEVSAGDLYIKNNPGQIRKIELAEPLHNFPISVSVKGGEYRFQRMLDVATLEMLSDGTINKILDKYDPEQKKHNRVAKAYRAASE